MLLSTHCLAQGPVVVRRIQVAQVQSFHYGEVNFSAESSGGTRLARGRFDNHVLNTLLTLPQELSKRDAMLWELEYRRHDSAFSNILRTSVDPEALLPAFGADLGPPFETLQLLRARWTWRHEYDGGLNLIVHNRTGLYGERLELDARWLRVGLAGGLEYRFSDDHSLGLGGLFHVGVGDLESVPFLRYQLTLPTLRVRALLPVSASVHWDLTPGVEVGLAYEAGGTHYRIDRAETRLDRVDRYFSTLGPSVRVSPIPGVFLRSIVGVQPFHIFDLHANDVELMAVNLDTAPSVQLEVTYEPGY